MGDKYFISLKEAQQLYGIEKTTFPMPRYTPMSKCAWCGRMLDEKNKSGFCNSKCASMYKVNTKASLTYMGSNYRLSLFYRDDFTCQKCGKKHRIKNKYEMELPMSDGQLDLHHIISKAEGGDDSPDNLTTWCRACHTAYHDDHHNGFKRYNNQNT